MFNNVGLLTNLKKNLVMKIQIIEPKNLYNEIMPEELLIKIDTAIIPLQSSSLEELGYKAWYSYQTNDLVNGHWEPEELEAEQNKIKRWLEIARDHSIYGGLYKIGMNDVFYDIVIYNKKMLLIEHKTSREGSAVDSDGHWYYESARLSEIKT